MSIETLKTEATKNAVRFVPIDSTEDGLALELVTKYPNTRWVESRGRFYDWNGTVWVEARKVMMIARARIVCRNAAERKNDDKEAMRLRQARTVSAVAMLAQSDQRYESTLEQWDADPWALNTPGGIVDLKTGETSPNQPEAYCTKITAVAPGGECEIWLKFLHRICGGDQELIDYLQRLAGYCLTGITREHVMAYLHGTGANGKGTYLNTISAVMADYAATAPIEAFTESHGNQHPTDLAGLVGARLVVAQETASGRAWAESRVKAITGGDPIAARFMRQDFFTFTPQFKLIIAGNHKPDLRNVDEAMRRRLHLVPFDVTVPSEERDPDLPEKLKAEWPGILAWAIDGCRLYLERRLDPPKAVRDATDAYFAAEDTFAAWIDECCDVDPNKWEKPTVLFKNWDDFANANGYVAGSQKTFAAALESRGFKPRKDGTRGRYWSGIAQRATHQSDAW